jgi:hypothetical protein
MTNEVIVNDRQIDDLLEHEPMPFEAAVVAALEARERRLAAASRLHARA